MIARQSGYILLPVVLLITLVATVAFLLNNASVLDSGISHSKAESSQVEYVAQAGMNHALWHIEQAGCGPYTDIVNEPLGPHSYSATITPNNAGGSLSTFNVAVSDDAWIKSDAPTQNFGNDAQLTTYFNLFSPSTTQRMLYRYDVAAAGIPAGAHVVSAMARIFVLDSNTSASVTAHQITADWDEASVNWDNINANHDSSSIATIASGAPVGQYVDVNITSLVQGWVNGSIANQGIMFKTTWIGDLSQFTSKEYGNVSQRPELIIKITDGSLSNRADINAIGTLQSGTNNSVSRTDVTLRQPASSIVWQPAKELHDAFIWAGAYEGKNFGVSPILNIKNDRNVLIRFALEALPPGARITEAKLELYLEGGSGVSDGVLDLHALNRLWVEGIYDDQSPPAGGGVTYQSYDGQTNWSTPGGDYDPEIIDTITLPTMIPGWYEWNVTGQIQEWLSGTANYGFLLREGGGDAGDIDFVSSDNVTTPALRPRLTVTLACECGVACLIPQGNGNVLLVVGDDIALDASDIKKKALFEAWGYTVNLLDDDASQSTFDSSLNNNDVAYISTTVSDFALSDKLVNTDKGVVNEENGQNDNLGLSSSGGNIVTDSLSLLDNSHYITAVFPAGVMPLSLFPMEGLALSGTPAASLQTLGELSGSSSLALIDTGGTLEGGGTASGRRVSVPIGSSDKFNWDYLNNNGRLMVQRAIQWGTGITGGAAVGKLLLVVGNAASPSSKDTGRVLLMESWGYAVTLIDDGASQADFDDAAAAADVVYVSGTIGGGALADKLTGSPAAIVNEFAGKLDNFGFSSNTGVTVTTNAFTATDASHYITEPFSGAALTNFTTNITMPVASGTLAPSLGQVASIGSLDYAIPFLDTGALRWDGNASPGRRVNLPFGGAETSQLTADGETLMRRAIEWGMIETPVPSDATLWFSTLSDVSTSGAPGLDDWTDGEVIDVGEPNLSMEPSSNGTLSSILNLDDFAADGNVDIDAIHYVGSNVSVGGAFISMELRPGDVLLSTADNETLSSNNTLSVNDEDVFVLRPMTTGDYSVVGFRVLLDGSQLHGENDTVAVSLVEKATIVGNGSLPQGSILFATSNRRDVQLFIPGSVGQGATSGTVSEFIDGPSLSFGSEIRGIDVTEDTLTVGGHDIPAGSILLTLNNDDAGGVGDNLVPVDSADVFYLSVSQVGSGPIADAVLLFEGLDINLDSNGEHIQAFSLTSTTSTGGTLPLAHWKMDDGIDPTATDSAGGHDGTLTNGPNWVAGQDGDALDFDGSNDHIVVAHADTLSITDTMSFTAWVNPDTIGGNYNTVLAKDGGGWGSNYYFGLWQDEIVFGFFSGGTFREVFTDGLGIQAGAWQHIAASFDNATDEVLLYLDGSLVHTGTLSFNPSPVGADLTIGKSPDGEYWRGLLDDVRIYDRVLPVDEIDDLYVATGGGGGGEPPSPPTGVVVFEGFTDAMRTSNGTSFDISKPAGTTAGDLLIAAVVTDGKQEDGIDPPAGWNLIDFGIQSERVSMGVWWKVAGAGEPASYHITWPEDEEAYGFVMRFSGHDPADPINVFTSTGGTSSSPVSPAVVTTVDKAMILRIGGFDDDDISVGDPGLPGHTAITMDKSSSGNGTTSGGAGYLLQSAAGNSGSSNFSLTRSEQYRSVTIAISPAP